MATKTHPKDIMMVMQAAVNATGSSGQSNFFLIIYHLISADAQVRPPPKASRRI